MRALIPFVLVWHCAVGGCTMQPRPGVALQEVEFAIQPHIVRRESGYFLRYQIAVQKEGTAPLRMVLCSKKGASKGYYYFSLPISHVEHGKIVERPLAEDQLTGFADQRAVYWLDPDGSETAIQIKDAARTDAP